MSQYGAAQMAPTVKTLRPEEKPFANPHAGVRMNSLQLLRLGAHLPLVIFIVLLGLFTYWYHRWPLVPWFATLLSVNVVLISTWPLAGGGWPGRDRWDWFPLLVGLMAIASGVSLGLVNYANIELWVHGEFLNDYDGVIPTEPPQYVSDAGIIRFAPGAVLDVAGSAGYHAWPHTYCAAPIIEGQAADASQSGSAQAAAPATQPGQLGPSVGFWAVGINCCSSRGEFTCFDAKDPDARAGVRIESEPAGLWVGHFASENYDRAIRMAAAANKLQVAESSVMVVWLKDPDAVVQQSWWVATCIFGLLSIGAGGISALSHFILTRVRRLDQVV